MNLVNYNPRYRSLGLLSRLFDEDFDGLTDGEAHTEANWMPPVDIREEAERYVLRADLPGVSPENIDINLENGVLTIQGTRETEARSESANYTRTECATGRFLRRFTLPDTTNSDEVEAVSHNGVLEISIPKQPRVHPRKIDVRSI